LKKYLKPATLRDLVEKAKPFATLHVAKTGNKNVNSGKLACVKEVVLALIPPDDDEVRCAVQAWEDEVDFGPCMGTIHSLTRVSERYAYNATKVKHTNLPTFLDEQPWQADKDIIIRPLDAKGKP
jgi:hypothetical protein